MSGAWSQLEQLLTCCICLDRYRQPKILPCQHSFCEPCLDGLVDYARRQIKCPECRAEHRLPYSGDPNFPVNFTLMRFLELYQRLTGEEVEPLPSMLERCVICSEKAEVTQCAHCDKKVCDECKNAHIQIMQRELQRLNSQIRRALSRFNEEIGQLKKCDDKLRIGCDQARTSIVDLAAGLVCLIKEKEKQLLKELDDFQQSEEMNLTKLREGVNDEYTNLVTNCELMEKNVLNTSSTKTNQSNLNLSTLDDDYDSNELMQWSDLELVEYREIFLKTLEFLRNFETLDSMEYTRSGLKLDVIKDLDNVRKQAANYASLKVQYLATEKLQLQQQIIAQIAAGLPLGQMAGSPSYAQQLGSTHALNQTGVPNQLNLPLQQSILMRSQSDHRLASQFAKKELLLQKQQQSSANTAATKYGGASSTNYGNSGEHDLNSQYGLSSAASHYAPAASQTTGSSQYRSRFMREKNADLNDSDDTYDPYSAHRVRFEDGNVLTAAQLAVQLQNAFKVFDTKDASRLPLSNIVKLNESGHFMERIDENKRKAKKLEKEKAELKAMSQPPVTQTVNQTVLNSQINHQSIQQQTNLSSHQSPIQQQQQQTNNLTTSQQLQNKAPPPNRQISEDEIDKQKRLNKQFELQSLNNNLVDNVNSSTPVNNNSTPVPSQQQQTKPQQQQQQLQKQNSIHGSSNQEPSVQNVNQTSNKIVNKNLLTGSEQQHRINQTSSEPDDEDEDIEDSGEEESDVEDDESTVPAGNNRQVISSNTTPHARNKLSGYQRPSFEESESKLMPVSELTNDYHHHPNYHNEYSSSTNPTKTINSTRRLSNSYDQPQQQQSLLNMGRTASIDRDYGQSANSSSSNYTSAGNKLSRQNSANSSNQTTSNIGNSSFITPRNSIDIGSTNYTGSRNNSFDRDNSTSYRYLTTRANTRLDDLLNRDSYTNDNSTSASSSNHNRFNRFNRLARSSTVSSLSPSYTSASNSGTSNTTANSISGGSTSSGSSNYRTYDLDSGNSSYLSNYSSANRNTDSGNSSYLSVRSRPSSPPPQTRSTTTSSGLSRYGIGNSSVGTSSGYRRTSAYTPDTSEEEIKYEYRTRVPKKAAALSGLFNEGKSSSLDISELLKTNDTVSKSINLPKQHSLESNLESRKESAAKIGQLKKSKTSVAYDLESDSSEDEAKLNLNAVVNKLFDATDQILFKQKLEQRTELYKNKGSIKLSIGKQGIELGDFKWPKDVRWCKYTLPSKLIGEQVIMVVDSGNNRVQVFDTQGKFLNSFGEKGIQDAHFDNPASICCFQDGKIVISDTNNHRLQWFDSKFNFIKSIGSKQSIESNQSGTMNLQRQISAEPGQFSLPYGLCCETDQIYVCDKGNERVQVLDNEGSFKRFLSSSTNQNRLSRLNAIIRMSFKSPNFIHSNGQQVIVSDTNTHCVHLLSLKNNQKVVLGGEGTSAGKFKYPRGVALDEFGFSIIADSGNNRISIFNPNGSFLKNFGSWGSSDGQFKGIEGISVDELGFVYVCDRENNRVQVF